MDRAQAQARARALVEQMTLEEQASQLRFSAADRLLTLEMGPVCGAGRDVRPMRLDRLEELELYLDGSTLEVFVNGGWATLTSRIFAAGDTLALDAFAGGAEFCPMGEFVIADARENGV